MSKKKTKKKILVVDDDPAILESLEIILEMEGYKVIPLLNTDKIYKEIRRHKPSLILLDVWLSGGVDGTEITRFIKAQNEWKNVPVILISALSNVEKAAKSSYADDFLAKPFEIDDVIDKVNKFT